MNDTANFEYQYEYEGDMGDDVEHRKIYIPSHHDPMSRHRIALRGYTGCNPHGGRAELDYEDDDDLEVYNNVTDRIKIRGFSGFVPKSRDIIGTPIIPSLDTQIMATQRLKTTQEMYGRDSTVRFEDTENDGRSLQRSESGAGTHGQGDHGINNFRTYGKNMELEERYTNSITQLWKRHKQTQQMLLRMVQSKLSSRVNSYATQTVRTRAIFDYFDQDDSKNLDEYEFRQFLELTNCYFDDVQSLALFAYFDEGRTGGIDWEAFKRHSMVHNPKGGTATIPKAITAVMNSEDWKSAAVPPKDRRKYLSKS